MNDRGDGDGQVISNSLRTSLHQVSLLAGVFSVSTLYFLITSLAVGELSRRYSISIFAPRDTPPPLLPPPRNSPDKNTAQSSSPRCHQTTGQLCLIILQSRLALLKTTRTQVVRKKDWSMPNAPGDRHEGQLFECYIVAKLKST